MKISLLFATHNGEYTLPMMMESLLAMKLPENVDFEIVAVCNACLDDSEKILNSYSDKLDITILDEGRPGKNIALNKGISFIKGDGVIVVDDDIIVDPNWLIRYTDMFLTKKDFDIFGGAIKPYWIESPPVELLDTIPTEMAYALTSADYKTGAIDATRLFGPNMGVRKEIFDEGVIFSESIGPASDNKNYVTGSETEFLKRAQKKGHTAYFDEGCIVQHIVRPWQLTQKWLNNRAFKGGKSVIEMKIGSGNIPAKVSTFMGYPRWALSKALKVKFKIFLKIIFLGLSLTERYHLNWEFYSTLGYAVQYRNSLKKGVIAVSVQ